MENQITPVEALAALVALKPRLIAANTAEKEAKEMLDKAASEAACAGKDAVTKDASQYCEVLGASSAKPERIRLIIQTAEKLIPSQAKQVLLAKRVSMGSKIKLPGGEYDNCSRGSSSCRLGKVAQKWAEKVDGMYPVDTEGKWFVKSSDGYHRSKTDEWHVERIGNCVWIAN